MDRIIRLLDVAHRIWGVLALVVFALLAYDLYGYYTQRPGQPARSVLVRTWRYVGETSGLLERVDDGSWHVGGSDEPGRVAPASTPAPRERSTSGGSSARLATGYAGDPSSGGVSRAAHDDDTADVALVAWSCPGRQDTKDAQRHVAQFPSLSKLTSSRQRISALRELEARLRCDYEAERAGPADAAPPVSYQEWRQVALQRRYGPSWSRIDLAELPTP